MNDMKTKKARRSTCTKFPSDVGEINVKRFDSTEIVITYAVTLILDRLTL